MCQGDEVQINDADNEHLHLSGDPDVGRLDAWLTGDGSRRSSPSFVSAGADVSNLHLPPARVGAIFLDDWDDFSLPFEDIPAVDDT